MLKCRYIGFAIKLRSKKGILDWVFNNSEWRALTCPNSEKKKAHKTSLPSTAPVFFIRTCISY